jgi:hypothetical protein
VSLAILDILDEKVGESADVSGVFEYDVRSDACGVYLEHFLLENEVFPPELFDVVLDGASDGSKIIESGTSSIDLKSLEEDISAFEQIVQ